MSGWNVSIATINKLPQSSAGYCEQKAHRQVNLGLQEQTVKIFLQKEQNKYIMMLMEFEEGSDCWYSHMDSGPLICN